MLAQVNALQPPAVLWKPRSGTGHTMFRVDLDNRLSSLDMLHVGANPPPTINDLEATHPYLSGADLVNTYKIAIAEYHVENTQLYHVVDTCVDLIAWG
eukprot:2951653-Prymnesium_polylepis.1